MQDQSIMTIRAVLTSKIAELEIELQFPRKRAVQLDREYISGLISEIQSLRTAQQEFNYLISAQAANSTKTPNKGK